MTLNTPLISRLFTTEQTRQMDQKTIREYGISGFTLMEIAAAGAAGIISEIQQSEGSGIFICGKGNNGGDALATARYLVDQYRHRDRKSTRLNSSHVASSYAVFCLKKKNKSLTQHSRHAVTKT